MSSIRSGNFAFTSVNLGKYSDLERYFEIQRSEHEAAKVIQKCWRRTRILLPWKKAVLCQKMAQRIQKRIRGVLTRKWVAEWFHTRNSIVITWQAHSRRYVSNKHVFPMLENEKKCAIKIQKIVRSKIARIKYMKKLQTICIIRIQALWRGVVGRLYTDKLWLNKIVIPLQSIYRRLIAQKRFQLIKKEFNLASTIIQKKFRNYYSKIKMGDKLFHREMQYRMNNIRLLTSEEELCQEFLTKSMERLIKNDYKIKAEKATKQLINCESEIYLKENDLTEYKRQIEILSSRARSQGFDVELTKNIQDTRNELTDLKLKYIFELCVDVHKADEILEDQVREVETWAAGRNRLAEWRSDQYDERRHLNYKREILARRKAKRIAIAEEKRRWQVLYFTADGKPDKKRRPGRPWDASIYAGGDKAVYSGGSGVNLMAHIQRERIKRAAGNDFKIGSIKSVEQTLQQVSLQTYLEEVNLYEQLLKPITQIMEKNIGINPMGLSSLAQNGWGAEGAAVVPALQCIGAISPPKPQRSRQGSSKKKVSYADESSSGGAMGSATPSALNSSRLLLYNNQEKVTVTGNKAHLLSKQSSFNSVHSTDETASNLSEASFDYSDQPTPLELLRAVKQRKKNARKSYLPALDAFTSMYDGSATKSTEQPYIGDLKTLDRLFLQQSDATAAKSVGRRSRMDEQTAATTTRGAAAALMGGDGLSVRRGGQQQLVPLGSTAPSIASTSRRRPPRAGGDNRSTLPSPAKPNMRGPYSSSPSSRSSDKLSASVAAKSSDHSNALVTGDEDDGFWHDITKAAREEAEARRLEVSEKRRERKRNLVRSSTIPWELLDQLDGAKHRFENEKLYHDFNHKY